LVFNDAASPSSASSISQRQRSDPQDWASGTADSYDAFEVEGSDNDITAPLDINVMKAVGYTVAPAPAATLTLITPAISSSINVGAPIPSTGPGRRHRHRANMGGGRPAIPGPN